MITEDYVSFDTAKLLKEKGFNWKCRTYFIADKEVAAISTLRDFNSVGVYISAPTLQMAMKWLREEKDVLIEMHHLYRKEWYAIVSSENPLGISVKTTDSYSSYEEACEAAIKYCLENLI